MKIRLSQVVLAVQTAEIKAEHDARLQTRREKRADVQQIAERMNAAKRSKRRGSTVGVRTDGLSHRSKAARKSRGVAKPGTLGSSPSLHRAGSARNRRQRDEIPARRPEITRANQDRHDKAVKLALSSTEVWADGLPVLWEEKKKEEERRINALEKEKEARRAKARKSRISRSQARRMASAWSKTGGKFRLKESELGDLAAYMAADIAKNFGMEVVA